MEQNEYVAWCLVGLVGALLAADIALRMYATDPSVVAALLTGVTALLASGKIAGGGK